MPEQRHCPSAVAHEGGIRKLVRDGGQRTIRGAARVASVSGGI